MAISPLALRLKHIENAALKIAHGWPSPGNRDCASPGSRIVSWACVLETEFYRIFRYSITGAGLPMIVQANCS
jgi:hypothetical protein